MRPGRQGRAAALALAGACLLAGCGLFGVSDEELLYRDGSSKPMEVPEGVDLPEFVDLMPIPEVDDYRGLGDAELEIGPPDALSTRFDVDQIVIRKLGTQQWVFIDMPPAIIWPEVLGYFEGGSLPLASQEPDQGILETEWLQSAAEEPEAMVAAFGSAGQDDGAAVSHHRFQVRLEPGIRSGSSELYVGHRQLLAEAPSGSEAIDWSADSDDLEVEGALLKAIAYHLGEATAEAGGPSVSMMAAGLTDEGKARLETGPDGLVLLFRLDFDRAWETVRAALENANVEVEDLDRSAGDYYVDYSSDSGPGFFRRLFSGDDDEDEEEEGEQAGQRFRIHLEAFDDEVEVTVTLDGELEEPDEDAETRNLLLSERLLKLIREHST